MENDSRPERPDLTGIKLIFFGIAAILLFTPLGKSNLFYWTTETPKYLFLGLGTFLALAGLVVHSQSNPLKMSRFNIPVFLFFLVSLLSTFFSLEIRTSIFGHYSVGDSLAFTGLMILLFVCAQQLEPRLMTRLMKIAVLPVLPVTMLTLYEAFYLNYYRSAAFMGNPVYLGAYAALITPMVLYKLEQSDLMRNKFLYGLLLLCCLVVAFLSYSRIPMILIAALLLWRAYKNPFGRILAPGLLLAAVFVALIHGAFFSSQGPQLADRVTGLIEAGQYATRIEMAKSALRVIGKSPVIGGGPGTYQYLAMPYISKKNIDAELFSDPEKITKGEPHNLFLVIGATLGLLGLSVFLWMLAYMALKYKYTRRSASIQDSDLLRVFYSICIFFVIIKLSQPNQMLEWAFFWICAGLIAGNFSNVRMLKIPLLPVMPVAVILFFSTVFIPVHSDLVLSNSLTNDYWNNYYAARRASEINPLNDYARVHAARNNLYYSKYGPPDKGNADIKSAVDNVESAIANNPYDVYFRLTAAEIYDHMAGLNPAWLKFAEQHIHKAIEIYPGHPVPKKYLIENLVKQNRLEEAKRIAGSIAGYKGSVEGLDELLKTIGE